MSWWPRLQPYRGTLGGVAALMVLEAAAPAATLMVLNGALTAVMAGDTSSTTGAGMLLVGVAVTAGALKVARTALSKRVAWGLAEDLRRALHGRLMRAPPGLVGDSLAALTDEVDQVQYGVSALITVVRNPITLMGLGAAAMWVSPTLTLTTGALLMPLAAVAWATSRWVGRGAKRARRARAALTSLAAEQLQGRDVVEAFGAQDREGERFASLAVEDRRARWWLDVVRVMPGVSTQVLAVVALCALLVFGAQAVAAGQLTVAALVAFAAGLALAQRPLSGLAEAGGLARRATGALERVETVLSQVEPVFEHTLPTGPLSIRLRGAQLGDVVGPIDVDIAPGSFVALVGATGSGKTTVLRWVVGLASPDVGDAWVGGVPCGGLPPELRPVAWVPQDGFLFARSVLDNLRLGAPSANGEAVSEALRIAQATQVAQGIEVLGPAGAPLSGGERQRLAIARALLADKPVLALDEPTAHVDPSTEAAIGAALQAWRQDHTLLVATHDLRLAAQADRVLVMEKGRIVEDGSPSELAVTGGLFAQWSAA